MAKVIDLHEYADKCLNRTDLPLYLLDHCVYLSRKLVLKSSNRPNIKSKKRKAGK